MKALPDIVIRKARCCEFESGFCYSADVPYYSGHYPTKVKAAVAAAKKKRELKAAPQYAGRVGGSKQP